MHLSFLIRLICYCGGPQRVNGLRNPIESPRISSSGEKKGSNYVPFPLRVCRTRRGTCEHHTRQKKLSVVVVAQQQQQQSSRKQQEVAEEAMKRQKEFLWGVRPRSLEGGGNGGCQHVTINFRTQTTLEFASPKGTNKKCLSTSALLDSNDNLEPKRGLKSRTNATCRSRDEQLVQGTSIKLIKMIHVANTPGELLERKLSFGDVPF